MQLPNIANYIGAAIADAEPALREKWSGPVIVIKPTQSAPANHDLSRLQVHISDQGIVLKVVNG